MDTRELLQRSLVFSCLDAPQLDELLDIVILRQYHKGQYLTHAGDLWPYLFFLLKGSISAIKESSEGRSLVATSFKAGEVFWGVSFFHPTLPMPVALKVDSQSSIYLWSSDQILPVLKENGAM